MSRTGESTHYLVKLAAREMDVLGFIHRLDLKQKEGRYDLTGHDLAEWALIRMGSEQLEDRSWWSPPGETAADFAGILHRPDVQLRFIGTIASAEKVVLYVSVVTDLVDHLRIPGRKGLVWQRSPGRAERAEREGVIR